MRKKIMALVLSVLMIGLCFALAGCGDKEPAADSDLAYIQNKGTLVVGITDFAPMDYQEEGSEEWIGFDADLARTKDTAAQRSLPVSDNRTWLGFLSVQLLLLYRI